VKWYEVFIFSLLAFGFSWAWWGSKLWPHLPPS
jgi:hypothetical protein